MTSSDVLFSSVLASPDNVCGWRHFLGTALILKTVLSVTSCRACVH